MVDRLYQISTGGVFWALPIGETTLDGTTVLKRMTEWMVYLRTMLMPDNCRFVIASDINTHRANARERLVERAIEEESDWIFWVDSDVLPPCHALVTLLARNADICGGLVVSRSYIPAPMIYRKDAPMVTHGWQTGDLVECHGMGFGCTVMRTEIFKKLEKPWFSEGYEAISPTHGYESTEDLPLMYRATDAGFSCYCDTSVLCQHVDSRSGARYYWDKDRHAPAVATPAGKKRLFPSAEQRLAYQAARDSGDADV